MALSKEQKDALNEHFQGKDLYDPTQDPNQEVSTFEPKGLCGGGEIGLADGGFVPQIDAEGIDASGANIGGMPDPYAMDPVPAKPLSLSAGDFHPQVIQDAPDMGLKDALASKITPPEATPAALPLPGSMPPVAPAQGAPAAPGKLQSDEYDQLIKYLQPGLGQRLGQGAMSGLGGLADAIMQGVARAGPSSFQKGIDERAQHQKENLSNALREKYETGFKGKQLGLETQKAGDENTRAANAITAENERAKLGRGAEKDRYDAELGVRAKEAEAGRAQSGLEAAAKLPTTGILHPGTWGNGDMIEAARNKLLGAGGATVAHPQDAKAVAWAKANPRDPRAAKILKANGQ